MGKYKRVVKGGWSILHETNVVLLELLDLEHELLLVLLENIELVEQLLVLVLLGLPGLPLLLHLGLHLPNLLGPLPFAFN